MPDPGTSSRHAVIVGTGPEGSALHGFRWLVQLDDGCQYMASVQPTLRNHQWIVKVAFDLGQNVWIRLGEDDSEDCIIDVKRSKYRLMDKQPTGIAQYTQAVLDSRAIESKTKWQDITDRRCPQCNGLSPEWQSCCWVCGFEIGADTKK